ncbi:alpha/beta hydrolase [Streptomyces sp. MI02-7b]|uniref:alpha/beta fold hydrolase n=1 Tax=Streptomyces sp. MI02-7b TaxID=462941 RepID=UPI0029B6C371|nr:alpha/beta hydrolase [Streptomyces sp. MI02-7b]MDX3074063.1 alpha/beta hydrolase [Streptomyces sp. MI02-7b]
METIRMFTIPLPDQRLLAVEVSGPSTGVPLVYHHGSSTSGTQFRFLQRAAHDRGLRLVSFSRPGVGASTRLPGRSVADTANDVAAVLDHLGASNSLQFGWSGGGPHALAVAARLPERVAGTVVMCSVAPYEELGSDFFAGMAQSNVDEFKRALMGENLLRPSLEDDAQKMRSASAEDVRQILMNLLSPADRVLATKEVAADIGASWAESLRHGVDGWVDETLSYVKPWGFSVQEIAVPTAVWHGAEDLAAPFAHGTWLAQHIPGATAHLLEGHGHMSIFLASVDQALAELASTL